MRAAGTVLEALADARRKLDNARTLAVKSEAKAKADRQAATNAAKAYETARAAVASAFPEVLI